MLGLRCRGAAFLEHQPPIVDAGPNQTITLPTNSVSLDGSVTDCFILLQISPLECLPGQEVSGPGNVKTAAPPTRLSAVTQATFSTSGTYVLQLSANDSLLSSSATTTITVNPEPISPVLIPTIAGPDVTGTMQAMTAKPQNCEWSPETHQRGHVQFTVTGTNASSGNATTDATVMKQRSPTPGRTAGTGEHFRRRSSCCWQSTSVQF